MEDEQPLSGHTFGTYLRSIRLRRGLSIRALELASSVANIPLMERGLRGPPRPRALHDIAQALDCTPEEEFVLFQRALGDRILKDLEDYAGYLFALLPIESVSDEDVASLTPLAPRRWGNHELTKPVMTDSYRDLLMEIAQNPERDEQREWMARQIFNRLTVDVESGAVVARLAPFAARKLDADLLHDEEAGVSARGGGADTGREES